MAGRSLDWAQVYPEWGLAGNAAFLVAPREVSRGIDLQRRVFLHSYEAEVDPDGSALETILTAPLVVAQWINCQYYFSTVAPEVFGAGTKTIHNVVGTAGVIAGHEGDLRLEIEGGRRDDAYYFDCNKLAKAIVARSSSGDQSSFTQLSGVAESDILRQYK